MVIRAVWHGGRVHGLNWTCRRAPGCEGVRRIRSPETIQPYAHDASAQAVFDWESAHDRRQVPRRAATSASAPNGGLRSLFGRVLSRNAGNSVADAELDAPAADRTVSMGYFDGLVEHGFVVLEDRRLPAARAVMDNVLIGPSGVVVVQRKSWAGQVSTADDAIYVDGRRRFGATDAILRATDALEQTLAHELKPLGATVRPAVLFDRATNKSFEGVLDKVLVGGTRGLPKKVRSLGEPIMGPETVVRLALAADRLLE